MRLGSDNDIATRLVIESVSAFGKASASHRMSLNDPSLYQYDSASTSTSAQSSTLPSTQSSRASSPARDDFEVGSSPDKGTRGRERDISPTDCSTVRSTGSDHGIDMDTTEGSVSVSDSTPSRKGAREPKTVRFDDANLTTEHDYVPLKLTMEEDHSGVGFMPPSSERSSTGGIGMPLVVGRRGGARGRIPRERMRRQGSRV